MSLLIWVIIILVVVILGGWLFMSKKKEVVKPNEAPQPPMNSIPEDKVQE